VLCPVAPTKRCSGTLARLAIDVPKNVTATATIRQPLEELARERCDKEAISHLAKDRAGNIGAAEIKPPKAASLTEHKWGGGDKDDEKGECSRTGARRRSPK